MQLFELEPVVSEMTGQAGSEHPPACRSTKKSTKHPARQELPASLPRIERVRDQFGRDRPMGRF